MSTYNQKERVMGFGLIIYALFLTTLGLLGIDWIFILILSGLFFIFTQILINPRLALFLLILSRPSLDIFTNDSFLNNQLINVNLSAIWGVTAIILAMHILFTQRHRVKKIALKKEILFFLTIAGSSFIYSVFPMASLTEFIRVLSFFAIFTTTYLLIKDKQSLISLIKVIIFSAIIPTIVGIMQIATGTGMDGTLENVYNRAFGTFAHPNILAYYLVFVATLAIFFTLRGQQNKINDLWPIFVLPAFVFLMIMTYTRGAWLAFVLALAPISLFKYRQLIFIGAMAILIGYTSVDIIQKRINEIFIGGYTSLDWRINLWKDAAKIALEKPILGFGAGTAKQLILENRGASFGSYDVHNDYIKILIENGIIGLAAYCLLLLGLLRGLIELYKQETDEDFKNFILLYLGAILALSLSLTDNIMRQTALEWVFWATAGGVLAIRNKNE